ncbi:MAG: hypothetical protein PHW56_05695 [Methanosarcinaceae archaeon]|nr:hypothetical protein [Methanosarcinaceae archaeon]
MQQTLQNVLINRQGINSIEFEKGRIELPIAPGEDISFEILITNYGSPSHIHLSVSEELKGIVTFLRDNPYVLQEEYISAVAHIPPGGRVFTEGKVHITAGYGSSKKSFPLYLGKAEKKKEDFFPEIKEVQAPDELDTIGPYDSSRQGSYGKSGNSGAGGGSGLLASFLKKLSFGTSDQDSQKNTRETSRNIRNSRKNPQNPPDSLKKSPIIRKKLPENSGEKGLFLASGGFLGLIFLFALYFYLPASFQYTVSFPQALAFSVLFVTCTGYILIAIMEKGG